MEPSVSSSLLVPVSSSHRSIRRASTAIQTFTLSVTPREMTPQENTFSSSINPLAAIGSNLVVRSSNQNIPLTVQTPAIQTPEGSQRSLMAKPSATAEDPDASEDLSTSNELKRPTDFRTSIRRVSSTIQALKACGMKPQTLQPLESSDAITTGNQAITSSSDDASSQRVSNQFLSPLIKFAEPAVLAAGAAYAGSLVNSHLARTPTQQKRFITGLEPLAAGAVWSAGSAVLSSAVPLCIGAYGLYKLNNFIHSGCERDKEKLADEFKKLLNDHKASTDTRLDTYAAQVSGVLQEVGAALEDTGNSLEQVATIVEQMAPAGDLSIIKSIHAQAARLQNVGQGAQHQQSTIPKKEKACCDCCIQ